MITTFYPPYHFGGDATYVRALSKSLVNRGHEVHVVHCEDAYRTVSHNNEILESTIDEGITIHKLKSNFGLLSPLFTQQTGFPGFKKTDLKRILKQNFDVIHFHNISLVGGPAVLKMSNALVTLYTLHEHWLLCPTHIFWKNNKQACDKRECFSCSLRSGIPPQLWRYTNLISNSLKSVDVLIAPSEYTRTKHTSVFHNNDIQVLPLFSALKVKKEEVIRGNNFQNYEDIPFIYVGRVTASKGIISLLKVFEKLPDVNLQIIGDGDLLTKLKKEYLNNSNIKFLGKLEQNKLIEKYINSKAVILPSLAPETFGLTIIEAFSCSTPALVRVSGGSRDIIDNTGGGFVYNNDEELMESILKLQKDAALRDKLGDSARQGYEKFYTEDIHLDSYMKLINNISNA